MSKMPEAQAEGKFLHVSFLVLVCLVDVSGFSVSSSKANLSASLAYKGNSSVYAIQAGGHRFVSISQLQRR